jgi:hypothetical protein
MGPYHHGNLVRIAEGRRPLGRFRLVWYDNIKIDLKEVRCSDVNWVHHTHDRNK